MFLVWLDLVAEVKCNSLEGDHADLLSTIILLGSGIKYSCDIVLYLIRRDNSRVTHPSYLIRAKDGTMGGSGHLFTCVLRV